ncbi:MAG TPA: hypothetical protein VKE88_00915 [Candidatus Nanoarchaeia archaeon]|nr:hypothetical protein [Candidatus Nanoarchaeia archaeon]
MNSIKRDAIFLIAFIVVVSVAFIVPNYDVLQKEDATQPSIEPVIVEEGISIDMNETLIKEESESNLT